MNRIEKVREIVDDILLHMEDTEERKCAYLHLYGVAQACALLAMKRNENAELAIIAGMLHDISSYTTMDSKDHAHKSAAMAKDILLSLKLFSDVEIDFVCSAIYNHSDKSKKHDPLDELLKDADVMQHTLYNPLFDITEQKKTRFEQLMNEFNIPLMSAD